MKNIVTVSYASHHNDHVGIWYPTQFYQLALGEGGFAEGVEAARGNGVPTNLWNGDSSLVRRVINFMLIGIAVVSVCYAVFGGFRYVISGGRKNRLPPPRTPSCMLSLVYWLLFLPMPSSSLSSISPSVVALRRLACTSCSWYIKPWKQNQPKQQLMI